MEHGLKDIAFYVQKHITACTVVITSLLVRDKPLGAPASVKWVYVLTFWLSKHARRVPLQHGPIQCDIGYSIALNKVEHTHIWTHKRHTITLLHELVTSYGLPFVSQVPSLRGLIYHDITCDIAVIVAESESNIRITMDTPYRALTGELWGVYCEDFGENWLCYNGSALYFGEK